MDFRNGARNTSDPRKSNTAVMAGFTKAMTDEEIKAAANYFTSIPASTWITVIESDTVPKTKGENGILFTLEGDQAGTEPIGNRIVETPVSGRDTEFLRNPRSGFIAYVPPGSRKLGEVLVLNGITASPAASPRVRLAMVPICAGWAQFKAGRPLAELYCPAAL